MSIPGQANLDETIDEAKSSVYKAAVKQKSKRRMEGEDYSKILPPYFVRYCIASKIEPGVALHEWTKGKEVRNSIEAHLASLLQGAIKKPEFPILHNIFQTLVGYGPFRWNSKPVGSDDG